MIPGSNFKALLSFLWTVSFFALLSSQGVEAQPAGSSFSLLPHRRCEYCSRLWGCALRLSSRLSWPTPWFRSLLLHYSFISSSSVLPAHVPSIIFRLLSLFLSLPDTTSFTAPILYRYSWGIDGARVSFGPVGSNGMYLSRKSLGTGTTIGQSQIDDCAAFCEMTNDCGFFHAIQLKGASDTNLICATYDGKMSKSTATLIKGPSFGGSAKVVYSYGFTRNSGPVSNPIASLSSTAATGVCTAKSSSTSTGSSTKATTTAAASTKATSATSSSTAAVSTATSQAQFALYQDYWGTSSTGLPDPADIPGEYSYTKSDHRISLFLLSILLTDDASHPSLFRCHHLQSRFLAVWYWSGRYSSTLHICFCFRSCCHSQEVQGCRYQSFSFSFRIYW